MKLVEADSQQDGGAEEHEQPETKGEDGGEERQVLPEPAGKGHAGHVPGDLEGGAQGSDEGDQRHGREEAHPRLAPATDDDDGQDDDQRDSQVGRPRELVEPARELDQEPTEAVAEVAQARGREQLIRRGHDGPDEVGAVQLRRHRDLHVLGPEEGVPGGIDERDRGDAGGGGKTGRRVSKFGANLVPVGDGEDEQADEAELCRVGQDLGRREELGDRQEAEGGAPADRRPTLADEELVEAEDDERQPGNEGQVQVGPPDRHHVGREPVQQAAGKSGRWPGSPAAKKHVGGGGGGGESHRRQEVVAGGGTEADRHR